MKAEARGKFRTLVHDDGAPITARCRAVVHSPPKLSGGKMYATIALGGCDETFAAVDRAIKQLVPRIDYSPLLASGRLLVVKIAGTALCDADLAAGDEVEVHMKLGNFGNFGYCWIASNFFKSQENEYGL